MVNFAGIDSLSWTQESELHSPFGQRLSYQRRLVAGTNLGKRYSHGTRLHKAVRRARKLTIPSE